LSADAIVHDPAAQRFVLVADGQEAGLDYEREAQVMVITHTVVPPAIGGRGIAARLVEAALRHARAQGWKVRPDCSYAASYLSKHAEYADLLA
jgi:uncharacterized protein